MKITLCGSIAFYDKMLTVQKELESLGHEVMVPPHERAGKDGAVITSQEYYTIRHTARPDEKWVWDEKKKAILDHFTKVAWAEAVLVLNYDKNNILGYVGANTLMEMGLALWLKKPIYLLNPVPEMQYSEEILGMKPIVLVGDLKKL